MKIATTTDSTIWQCDRCDGLAEVANAFTIPFGWWTAHIERRTEGGKLRRGEIIACSKSCLTEAITYQNQDLVTE